MTSSSPKKICPSVGFNRPQIKFRVVLFPQPEGPKRPMSLPSGISKSKSFTAMTSSLFLPLPGNFLVRFFKMIFMRFSLQKVFRRKGTLRLLQAVRVFQIAGYMVQVGIDEALRHAEYVKAVDEVVLPVAGNDDFIQGVFIADIL